MSRPALKDERARLAAAQADGSRVLDAAEAAVRDAERALLAAATGDGKGVVAAEKTLREAEAARDSVRRRLELLDADRARLDGEAASLAREESIAALRDRRAKYAARFHDAEKRLEQHLPEIIAAVSELDACNRRDATAARQLEELGVPFETGPCYGPWAGSPPWPHGTFLVDRAVEIARERVGATAPAGTITLHVPFFPPTE